MGLTGSPLLWVLGAFALALPIATTWWWRRLSSRRAPALAGRVALVVASQVAAVAFAGVAVNHYAYLYGSWDDVVGSLTQTAHGAPSVSTVPVASGFGGTPHSGVSRITTMPGYTDPARWARTGRLESVVVRGAASELSEHGYVYLPPQYYHRAERHTAFPGVEAFSGYPSTRAMLVKRLDYQKVLLRQVSAHHARPMVLVMMRPIVNFPRDTECSDVPGGPQAETFYAQDVPRAVEDHYRVRPTHWGIMGVSTGGYCATKIAMDYSSRFAAAVSLSGYYHALRDDTTGDLWGGSRVLRDLNSPEWRLAHEPAPPVSLLLTISRDEKGPLGYGDTRRFLRVVKAPMRVSDIIEAHGSHTFTTWAPEIPKAIDWLSARI